VSAGAPDVRMAWLARIVLHGASGQTLAVITKVAVSPATTTLPLRAQTTAPLTPTEGGEQFQLAAGLTLTETKVKPAGSASETVTVVKSAPPLFSVIVYEMLAPAMAVGGAVLVSVGIAPGSAARATEASPIRNSNAEIDRVSLQEALMMNSSLSNLSCQP